MKNKCFSLCVIGIVPTSLGPATVPGKVASFFKAERAVGRHSLLFCAVGRNCCSRPAGYTRISFQSKALVTRSQVPRPLLGSRSQLPTVRGNWLLEPREQLHMAEFFTCLKSFWLGGTALNFPLNSDFGSPIWTKQQAQSEY